MKGKVIYNMCNKGLTLAPIFCDGMVLQRDINNYIYGSDTGATTITIYFMDTCYHAKVGDNHEFSVELPPVNAGGPYSLTLKGSSEITIEDIMFGDVYILSGQSNMELPIRRVLDVSAKEIKSTCEPYIRQYLIPATFNFNEPEKYMYASSWKKAMGDDLLGFSAAGYFFAKEIKEAYQVPIGLIMTAVGGSSIESWMNPVTLSQFGDYDKLIKDFKNIDNFHKFIQDQQNAASEWNSRIEEEECRFNPLEEYQTWDVCRVPSLVSDYNNGTFQGSIYLCREVLLNEEPVTEDSYIYMGSIIDSDRIWINNIEIGRTEYRYPPRKYKIDKGILKKGSNLITVRIVINNKNGGTIKGKPYHLHYNNVNINLEGEWHYKIGKKVETSMPTVLFPPTLPTCFYNTVVAPLSKISVRGILWYQGERNTEDPVNYANKFAAMVSDWRDMYDWEVPFIYVQLPNYREPLNTSEDTGWAELREQQRQCLNLYEVAMVTALDIGEANDLHPQNKKVLGVRLAMAAKSLIYHEKPTYSGPVPKGTLVEGKIAKITFQYLEDTETEYCLNNFELAGEDGIFRNVQAIRKGKYVYLSSNHVETPKYVRYAWCDCPSEINFYNELGLPGAGFRLEL